MWASILRVVTKNYFVSGSYKEDRYIIELVVAKGRSFTSFEEMKRQLDINEQPSIGNICEYPVEEFTDLPKVSKKEAEKKNGKLQAKLNIAKKKRRNSETKIKTLNAQIEEQKQQVDTLAEEKAKVEKLETAKKEAEDEKTELQTEFNAVEQEKQNLENEIKQKVDQFDRLKADLKDKNSEVEKLNKDLAAKNTEATKLQTDLAKLKTKTKELENAKKEVEKDKAELEAKNKTTEQPKQSNAALYTATVGMGLAAGLIAFTVLERTVRLEMLVMIGIAVASVLVAGGITYAALPSTQVNGAEADKAAAGGKAKG
ncbi:hypothetical protein HC358_01735 [Wolbachia pipientis]|uniref:Uncharacterized protein n=1 Tax=Wolbachia pipientis TaxID=955 RepID=A0A7G5C9F2_WOLPI|nr:hypothetical protein [Wolbachia pipientis]QMV45836.1 hypothetical protein HC358_01735 [Wolbachia pipientis]